jgi:hypothetical protein
MNRASVFRWFIAAAMTSEVIGLPRAADAARHRTSQTGRAYSNS